MDAEVIDPVAPASRSASRVIASSPSIGASMASPPSAISARSLAAACGHSILNSFTISISRAMRTSSGTGSSTPDMGASWTMIGMPTAPTAANCSKVCWGVPRRVAP